MAYIPGAMRKENHTSGRYVPGSITIPQSVEPVSHVASDAKLCHEAPQPVCECKAETPKEPQYLSPELQALVDAAKAREQAKESSPNKESNTEIMPLASDADWAWLRAERNKRLAASDGFQAGLTFEQRGQLFKYRQELRDLPVTVGTKWTRESVKWPAPPSGSVV